MDGCQLRFSVRTFLGFLFLILLQTSTEAQEICSAPQPVQFAENNTVGDVVVTITVQPGVTVGFKPPENPDNPFRLNGNTLIAETVLDFETTRTHIAEIICTATSGLTLNLNIIIIITNVNDNPPVFPQNPYFVNVSELSPIGTTVGRFPAVDLDGQQLQYTLMPESTGFRLQSPTAPDILVERPLEYDKVKNVQLILTAQDSPLTLASRKGTFTASTTIMITIVDVDNRPPWFQPCIKHEIGGALICQGGGYTGSVTLNEQETGPLPLKPGPLHAIDGDSGLNEEIVYSFLGGNGNDLFEINPDTGNITMKRKADKLGPIQLTVVAAQKVNSNQFATTTVTISVLVKSLHSPRFQRPEYEGVVTGVGNMAMDLKNKDEPLQILAIDDDYAATGGLNPNIVYEIKGNNNFSIVDGYLFMTTDAPAVTSLMQVVALDTTNEESATAQLTVEVVSGLTTSAPLNTTHSMATSVGESTINSKTTEAVVPTTNPSVSPDSSFATTIHSPTPQPTSTSNSSMPTESSVATTNPSEVITPSGGYGSTDMAVLGATLGVLLFICLVVIGVLIFQLQRGKADWRKIYETNLFRSSMGKGNQKKGIQYTNDAFQNNEDGDSTGSGDQKGGSVMAAEEPKKEAEENKTMAKSLEQINALLRDDTSQTGSDKSDSEKEVRPILTKERRVDEGYKSVWFKEDPDAMEEVVIISNSRNNDSDEEEDEEQSSSSREEDEDDGPQIKAPKVVFNETDLDSGVGLKNEDSDKEDASTEM